MKLIWIAGLVAAFFTLGCESLPAGGGGLADASSGGFSQRAVRPGVSVVRGVFAMPTAGSASQTAAAFVDQWRAPLGLESVELDTGEPRDMDDGLSVVRHRVSMDGVEVLGAHVDVTVGGSTVYAVGSVLPTQRPAQLTPTLDAAAAQARAEEAIPDAVSSAAELFVLDRSMFAAGAAHLVWEVPVDAPSLAGTALLYVDATDGDVVHLAATARAARDRAVFNMDNDTELALGTQIYEEAGLVSGASDDDDAQEAFLNALLAHDYFEASFARDYGRIEAYVHYGPTTLGNAYARTDGRLLFSDGQMSEDIFAHEFTHRVINEETAQRGDGLPALSTTGEAGAVHEAIADIFAMLAGRRDRWQMGSDGGTRPTERDIENPSTPRTYASRELEDDLGSCDDVCGGRSTCENADGTCDPLCFATVCSANVCYVQPSCANDYEYVHSNSTVLSHPVFVATREGLDGRPPLGDAKMEQILFSTVRGRLGGIMGLQYTCEAMVDACHGFAVWRRLLGGDDRGITIEDCAVLRNAFAAAGLTEADGDYDGWPDSSDNCPGDSNSDQSDGDGNGVGDVCDASDGSFPVTYYLWNDSSRAEMPVSAHFLVDGEIASSANFLEPASIREVPSRASAGQAVTFSVVAADGEVLHEVQCSVQEFHRFYAEEERREELRVMFRGEGVFCDLDWIAPR